METYDGRVTLNGAKQTFDVTLTGGKIALKPVPALPLPRLPQDALPDGRIATGTGSVARAWLANPTKRYPHGALGDTIEAASLTIEMRDGKMQTVDASDEAVFEELEPRIVTLGGADHILTVKSYLKRGSALAVIGQRGGTFGIVAETPAIGTAHRWLNIAGTGNFLGPGRDSVAIVLMPHAVGRLQVWEWKNGSLFKQAEADDFSNHIYGTRALHMSAVADFDGDGASDLAIPSFDRQSLRIVGFIPKLRDIARLALPAPIRTNIALLQDRQKTLLVFGLENGALAIATR